MPLTRISLGTAWRPAEFAQLSALFHECLVAEFDVPSADRFQFIERAADEQRIYDRTTSAKDAAPASCCFIFSPENRAAGRRNRDSIVGSARG